MSAFSKSFAAVKSLSRCGWLSRWRPIHVGDDGSVKVVVDAMLKCGHANVVLLLSEVWCAVGASRFVMQIEHR